jgi:glutathione synthase/RimK-type ligase-like ATP-grasp enzyme
VPAVWDDPSVDWDGYALVVVRSTWDYVDRRDAFVAWARTVPRLANPAAVLAWNTDKRYLAELAAAGLPTVPTEFLAPGDPFAAPDAAELVVKPTVSAGSRDTRRHSAEHADAAAAHVAELHAAGRTAMVQPYLGDVDHAGETALLYLGGALSHAIRKGPMLPVGGGVPDGLFALEDISRREPSAGERALGERVMSTVRARWGELLYARVDLLPAPGGEPVLIELELTEPSLFLGHAPGAPERLAAAIAAAVGR